VWELLTMPGTERDSAFSQLAVKGLKNDVCTKIGKFAKFVFWYVRMEFISCILLFVTVLSPFMISQPTFDCYDLQRNYKFKR
jgi:hypothetical protein